MFWIVHPETNAVGSLVKVDSSRGTARLMAIVRNLSGSDRIDKRDDRQRRSPDLQKDSVAFLEVDSE